MPEEKWLRQVRDTHLSVCHSSYFPTSSAFHQLRLIQCRERGKGKMNTYYTGTRAWKYNTRWHAFSERTLAEALAMIDVARLRSIPEHRGRFPRVLDVACGTGLLLNRLLDYIPDAELYGLDASEEMLVQARAALKNHSHVYLERVNVSADEIARLPFAQKTFDLITCTNALHDLPDTGAILSEF